MLARGIRRYCFIRRLARVTSSSRTCCPRSRSPGSTLSPLTRRSPLHKTVGVTILNPEVYLSNDLVVRAGDIGDCIYFNATGTVAVYSLKGVEVCHLEDVNHFGEVALLMKDSKRVATVVAVENTQLYRLDALDFNRFVLSHSALYRRIEELASRRMHETVLLDDKFHRDRREQHPLPKQSQPGSESAKAPQ